MKLPLSFVPGQYGHGILIRRPEVLDADGKRVVSLAFTSAFLPGDIKHIDDVAALFAAAPDLRDSLQCILARFNLMAAQLPLEQHEDAANCIMNAEVALARAAGGVL